MSLDIYKNMLLEEIDRKKRAMLAFNNDNIENNRMPIYFKNVKGNQYIYINDGKNGKFHYKFLGNVKSFSSEELEKLLSNSKKYNENINSINEIKDDIDKLVRMVKVIG